MKVIHESDVAEKEVPGRFIRWIADKDSLSSRYLSSCVIRVLPGNTVRPAHAHTGGEELIYIMSGTGKVWIDGEIGEVRPGSAVLFEEGKPHMLRNDGGEEMKAVCFFAPPTSLDDYRMYEDLEFEPAAGGEGDGTESH